MTQTDEKSDRWQDQFLGEELSLSENDPATAFFHVIPCGLEKTVSYGTGTKDGPQAIIAASHQLERMIDSMVPCAKGIFTHTPIDCGPPIKLVLANLQRTVSQIISDQHIPIILGGEHSLSYGAVMGVKQSFDKPFGIVQIDAHADLRLAYQSEPHSHASVMNLLVREHIPLFQLGVRAFCEEEAQRRADFNVGHIDARELVCANMNAFRLPDDFPEHIYISFDLDGLDPSIMPATGTPVAGGLGFYQALNLIESVLDRHKIIGADIVELAPHTSHSHCDFTAALVSYHLMRLAILSHAGHSTAA